MTMTAQGTDAWRFALTDLVRYSGASLDFNTIHHDAAAGRAAGFDGVMAHGMLILGRVLARVADETGLYDERVAKEVGLPGVPGVPTLAFALPVLGWYLADQTDPAPRRPDPVADSARWAQSSGPVVHAGQTFTYRRPLTAGERVRSRRWITGRNTKVGSTGELRFTEVTQLVTDERDEPVVAAAMALLATGPSPAAT
jgi:acyl dehydratase